MGILSFYKENCIEITDKLLYILNVKVASTTLEKDLYNHPDYPSLLSISDVLAGYGVENIAVKSTTDKLVKMPMPFIAPIKSDMGNGVLYTVVESVEDNTIRYYHPEKHQWQNIGKEDFGKKWPLGIVLLADAEEAKGEKDYVKKRNDEKRSNIAKYATWSMWLGFILQS